MMRIVHYFSHPMRLCGLIFSLVTLAVMLPVDAQLAIMLAPCMYPLGWGFMGLIPSLD